ncbi:MAG TPA: hypothetical protein VEG38_23300 [Acidimicrobiia bacterium]|nr:hypothetical protein [Acidimicrobiia bacterium]
MGGHILLSNRDADVELILDDSGNGPRVQIHRSGRAVWVDPLALSSLAGPGGGQLRLPTRSHPTGGVGRARW